MPRLDCHRKGCTRIRSEFSLFLSRRHPPCLDGYTFCSDACLEAHLEAELSDRWHRLLRERSRRIPRPRLGTILLQDALITADQLDEAVSMQRQTHQGRLGEWLQRLGFVDEHQITVALAKQYGLPLINLTHYVTRSEAASLVPGKVAKYSAMLPLGYDDSHKSLQVAVAGPVNFRSQEVLRRMVRKGLLTFMADESAIDHLIEQWYEPQELDICAAPTYGSLDELLGIGRELLAAAANQRADNIQAELLEDFFWARIDVGTKSRHVFCRHTMAPVQVRAPLPENQFAAVAVGVS
ncbi:MAG TPA: hypothetical protein VE398_05265 [Acidobacteriota bacterium]|nr:hypothetical protein [Acidobacteriota bacterium]